jgi:transposase InsO family protein
MDDWVDLLPMAEFAYNNSVTSATGLSLFYANYRYHPIKIFAREIWKLHGLPTDIVSDRDSRFTSTTWKAFIGTLGIKPRILTVFHPQTNRQME